MSELEKSLRERQGKIKSSNQELVERLEALQLGETKATGNKSATITQNVELGSERTVPQENQEPTTDA